MPTTISESLAFDPNHQKEHANILLANGRTAEAIWELGARLLRFKTILGWQKLEGGGAPYKDWSDYLKRGVRISVPTAYKYMDAATWPRAVVLELGPEKACWLKRCTDLTVVDETPEQALALELPVEGGTNKPARDLTADEVEQAYHLMHDTDRSAKRALQPAEPGPAAKLEQTAEKAVAQWLTPGDVRAFKRGGKVLLAVTVPEEQAADVFSALAAALRP